MKPEDFIGEKVTYDRDSQVIFGVYENDPLHTLLDVRGWGAIQNLFNNGSGLIDLKAAGKFQDELAQWYVDAINEKLNTTKELSRLQLQKLPYMPTGRDYIEDTTHENGNYENKCIECSNMFFGHKRRVTCKTCFNKTGGVFRLINPLERDGVFQEADKEWDTWHSNRRFAFLSSFFLQCFSELYGLDLYNKLKERANNKFSEIEEEIQISFTRKNYIGITSMDIFEESRRINQQYK